MSVDPHELTDEERKLLAEQADETGRPWSELLGELFAKLPRRKDNSTKGRTLFDALNDKGMIGSITDGPEDWSTSPKHMEGLGEAKCR